MVNLMESVGFIPLLYTTTSFHVSSARRLWSNSAAKKAGCSQALGWPSYLGARANKHCVVSSIYASINTDLHIFIITAMPRE
jgi:hypothetical protein